MSEPRVLAVDDEQETCDLLKMSLEREGFNVTTCTSAEAALELVGAVDFDLVITDLSMPEMGGLDAIGASPAVMARARSELDAAFVAIEGDGSRVTNGRSLAAGPHGRPNG